MLVGLVFATLLAVPASGQHDFRDEPLLASAISEHDVEMAGRYARQWHADDGSIVVVLNGGFRLDMGKRRLLANNAVVWIESGQSEATGRKYYELTVYLSEDAEVREPSGTVTMDSVLLVRGLRTYGQIIKSQDAHAPESIEDSPLYQQALRDRQAIESGGWAAGAEPMGVTHPDEALKPTVKRPTRVIRYRLPNIEPTETASGERVFVATGGVYFSQDGGPDSAMLEIRADNAVVFPAENMAAFMGTQLDSEQPEQSPASEDAPDQSPERERAGQRPPDQSPERERAGQRPPDQNLERERADQVEQSPAGDVGPNAMADITSALGVGGDTSEARVRAVYLEGDVVLSLGSRFVRARRLYYDFARSEALILDAVFRADLPEREIPLYIRAGEIRQLSAREFSADDAVVTTSEFFTPSYHIGAERIVLRDVTQRDSTGQATGPVGGQYELTNTTLNVEGVPLLWWPYSSGTLQTSETTIRRLRSAYSGDFGYELETSWYLFNLLGVEPPPGYDATLELDYLSRRGPAIGVNVDYRREDHYGLFRGYYIHDDGEDNLGPLRRSQEAPSTSERGRVLWRHRHYLPYDWEATIETAYISDANFLEEFRKPEYRTDKEQETLLHLKRARDTEAITFLANWRMLDFLTQTEHLPELAYRRIGDTFLDPVVLYHESRIGAVRRLLDNRYLIEHPTFANWGSSDVTFRLDARQEAELPLKLGALNVVPFAAVRGSYWDGQPLEDGSLWRGLGVYGVRGGISFSRVYDEIKSELLDIHRIRHIIKPDFAAWWAHSNTRSELITPFDYGIETIDDFYGFTAGVRQTWQTKRGAEGRRNTVDLLTLNLEAGVFGNTEGREDISNGYANPLRPENSRTRNYIAGDLVYRLSDTTSLLYDFNVDMNDWSYDRHNVALAVERSPRLAYVFGTRYAGDIDMNLVGGGWNYRLNKKHATAVRAWYDIESGDLGEITLAYVRKLPRWHVGVSLEYDNIDDDFTISLSIWPEGIPEWTIGSKRFNSLATSTGIRP